ncbi:MAG: two-component system, NtrC family, nitrogen regulation sensor histidine kinase NtrY [Blastocatellia bacterium]|nr:two-component system, NtrC family, nitrogen regulation sensor histidine kinase NtrY [Blastocatellia bacterium]
MKKSSAQTVKAREATPLRGSRRTVPWLLAGIVAVLLALIVAQQLLNRGSVVTPETGSDTLLLYALSSLNFAAFIVFSFILLRSLLKLRRERREGQTGSRIQTRLLVYFIGLSLLPIAAMAAFSYLFLNRSIEKWMGRLPENVVERVREQQRDNLTAQNSKLRETATLLATAIKARPQSEWQTTLDQLAATGELSAIEIISDNGQALAHSEAPLPQAQRDELNSVLQRGRAPDAQANETLADGKGFDLTAVPLMGTLRLILVPRRLGDTDVNDTIAGSQREYQHLLQRQRKVRLLGLSTLGLMTLLLLFASTWVAIHLARGLAAPIRSLAEASKEVARGNLSHRVDTIADDELALLAESFNQMTAELDQNRRHIEDGATALREKNLALEERRNYIETVLESLSTGVVSLDQNDCVTTINTAAISILRLSEAPPASAKLTTLLSSEDRVALDRLLRRARRAGRAAEQSQLTRGAVGGAIPVALTATALRGGAGADRGVVLVIEDLSELLSAQRAAAWSEVARRIAHEIKNPLTPIQLSAERIARNFRVRLNGIGSEPGAVATGPNGSIEGSEDSNGNGFALTEENREELTRVVEECTTSITREVAGLKALVDEFSRFARMPTPRMEAGDLNEVIRQTAQLYADRLEGAELHLLLAEQLPPAMLDTEQLKRVFVNLTDNALESLATTPDGRGLTIRTRHDAARDLLIVTVEDTGEGIPAGDYKRLFQPYFSTRGRGTGLGLAIVARIITEHGGRVYAEGNVPHGARFVIELPVTETRSVPNG